MAVATYEDVAIALGRPISTPTEQAQVNYWLDGIERFIRQRFGSLSALDQGDLKYVETEAVASKVRRLTNDGATSITVAVDDANVTRRFEARVDPTDISDALWDLLDPASASDAFTISPYATRQAPIGHCRHGDAAW